MDRTGLFIAIRTLAIGGVGAALAWLVAMPAPFLTGPAILVTLCGLAGLDMSVPTGVRNVVFVVIGLTMGQTVTPEVIEAVRHWPVTLAMLAALLVAIIALTQIMLSRGWRMDRTTGLLCASPGHLSYVLGLTEGVKADLRTVSIVQSIRVLCLTLIVPVAVALAGPLPEASAATPPVLGLPALALVLAGAFAAGFLLDRLRLPAAYVIGSMVVGAVLHGTRIVTGVVPPDLALAAFVAMGSLIGTRFSGVTLAELRRSAGAGLAVTALATALAIIFSALAARLTGFDLVTVLIAFAPGGVETMSAMSVLLGLDPTFVAAHHVARLMLLTFIVPVFVLGWRRDRAP
jgi:membrane protein AbrB duplication